MTSPRKNQFKAFDRWQHMWCLKTPNCNTKILDKNCLAILVYLMTMLYPRSPVFIKNKSNYVKNRLGSNNIKCKNA